MANNPDVKTPSEQLKSHAGQNVKAKQLLDASNRVQFLIVTTSTAKHGAPAHRTEYVYLSLVSTQIIAWKETDFAWDSAWDADFTT